MKLVVYSLLVLVLAAWVAVTAGKDPGYVLISFQHRTLETSVVVFCSILILLFVSGYALFRGLIATGLIPHRFLRWRRRQNQDSGRKGLSKGMQDLYQGRWAEAEKRLLKSARKSDLAPVALVEAARAAQAQGKTAKRDLYLEQAEKQAAKNDPSVQLIRARLLSEQGEYQAAVDKLRQLPQNHPEVLRGLSHNLSLLQNWRDLLELLPQMKRNNVLPQHDYYKLEQQAYRERLLQLHRQQDGEALEKLWRQMPARLQDQEELLWDYASAMISNGKANEVEDTLYRAINKHWSNPLVYLYGLLDGDAELHLSRARNWHKKQSGNPALLLSLGRLAMRAQRWEEARGFLESSLKLQPDPKGYQELGDLLAYTNQQALALECYRKGLALCADEGPRPALQADGQLKLPLPITKPLLPEVEKPAPAPSPAKSA